MRRIFEFQCAKGHITEKLVNDEVKVVHCPHCGNDASRIISSPRIKLEGLSGSFPTAYDSWARKHEEASKVAYKKNEDLYR